MRRLRFDAQVSGGACPVLTAVQRSELEQVYGRDRVDEILVHDRVKDHEALRRQLAHESKTEITLAEFRCIDPYACAPDTQLRTSLEPRSADDAPQVASHQVTRASRNGADIGIIRRSIDAAGACVALQARGEFDVPPGWTADDKMTRGADGLTKLRTRFTGPNGEAGMIVRSFDGHTLHLDKAYKSTLPTRLSGVPGFDRPVSCINYMTARACRMLGVEPGNLKQIKVNRLQHQPTLLHLDWLKRQAPGRSLSALIGHTTWAKTYIRETADIVGHRICPRPMIDLAGSAAWNAAHPDATQRDWDYLGSETERLVFKHQTGRKIAKVDDPSVHWKRSAADALADYKQERAAGLSRTQARKTGSEIDTLLAKRLAAIAAEEAALRQRYGLAPGQAPRHFNFDVTYRTVANSAGETGA